jgi:hypothetical protein
VAGSIKDRRIYKNDMLLTAEELTFVAGGSSKLGVKIHGSMEKAFTLHPY